MMMMMMMMMMTMMTVMIATPAKGGGGRYSDSKALLLQKVYKAVISDDGTFGDLNPFTIVPHLVTWSKPATTPLTHA